MQIEVGSGQGPRDLVVVLLHGFMGRPEDLAPFARSMGVRARFVFPEGFVDLAPRGLRGRAWWPIDVGEADTAGDPSRFVPPGLAEARARMNHVLDEVEKEAGGCALVVGGFSQGAMLACDVVLHSDRNVGGLAMFSGAPMAAAEWRPRYRERSGLRTFVSHGRGDAELPFALADSFQAELKAAGWRVTWVPFDAGHEIPLVVWRAFKRWLTPEPPASLPSVR